MTWPFRATRLSVFAISAFASLSAEGRAAAGDCAALASSREPFALTWTVRTTTKRGVDETTGQRQIFRQPIDGEAVDIFLNPPSRLRSRFGFVVTMHRQIDGKDRRGTIEYGALSGNPFSGMGPFTLSAEQTSSEAKISYRLNGVPRGDGTLQIGPCTIRVVRYDVTRYEKQPTGFRETSVAALTYAPDLAVIVASTITSAQSTIVMSASNLTSDFDRAPDIGD